MSKSKYLILNENSIAENYVEYDQPLLDVPINYIEVNDNTMLGHKLENGVWSEESFNQHSINIQPTLQEQIAQLQQDNLILMDALATVYEAILTGGTV